MPYVIQIYHRTEPYLMDYMTGEPRQFPTQKVAESYARLSFGPFPASKSLPTATYKIEPLDNHHNDH